MKRTSHLLMFLLIAALSVAQANGKEAKYVFYFIGDGMGVNQVNGTEMFLAEKQGRIGTESLCFTQFPAVGLVSTYSRYNSVTDSSAGGTALSTGQKTKNGSIGMDSLLTTPMQTIAEQAALAGRKVGISTSVSIDHATPAAFYAHRPSRSMYYEIATDLPKAGFDFYAGAGFLKPKTTFDKKDAPSIYPIIEKAGYTIAEGYDDFNAKKAKTNKIVLIQEKGSNNSNLSFAIDRQPGDMTLSQITEGAISFLTKDSKKGFFLMVEGGSIDWACHGNDAATTFHEVIDMDNAIKLAYAFYLKHPQETLIVVTADHETGGIVLGTGKYELNLKALSHQKQSQNVLSKKINQLRTDKKGNVSWEEIQTLLGETMGFWKEIKLTEKQEEKLHKEYEKSFCDDDIKMAISEYAEDEPLAAIAVKIINEIAKVGWVSGGHSAGYVPVFAIGAGSEQFIGKQDNTAIPQKIAKAAGYIN